MVLFTKLNNMGLNIITIEIDADNKTPIKLIKPEEFQNKYDSIDELLKKDIKDMAWATVYLASTLSEDDELIILNNIKKGIEKRLDEIT
jgi:hypothetical protein